MPLARIGHQNSRLLSSGNIVPHSKPNNEPPLWKIAAREAARRGEICPICLGLGVVKADERVGHPDFGKLFPCPACAEGNLSNYLRNVSGLEGQLRHYKLEDFNLLDGRRAQSEAVKALLSQGHGWLTIWGGYGRGKTFLLAAAVNQCCEKRRPAVYVTGARLLDHLRNTFAPDSEVGYTTAFEQWCN